MLLPLSSMGRAYKLAPAWLALAVCSISGTAAAEGPLVAVAANLSHAMMESVQAFERTGGKPPRLSFGSSGNFYRQIRQGAPFELFLSADEDYVLRLAEEGKTVDEGVVYAVGRLVLFIPSGSPLQPDESFDDLAAAVTYGRVLRFAIANPVHAPYGRAAREVLVHRKLWTALENRLVVGENAAQTMQFALSGGTQAGIIPYALALAPGVSSRGEYVLIPSDWHAPIRQRMVLLSKASPEAKELYEFLQHGEARAILARHGYELPEANR